MGNNRYALLTVDTEALPNRATADHVKRLILGEHNFGTAGVREICAIGNEFNAKHIFFVDICGAQKYYKQIRNVISWLNKDGQDVELHAHPEYISSKFWRKFNFKNRPRFLNLYTDFEKTKFLLSRYSSFISKITGKKIIAFRAGSFRWNAITLKAMAELEIPLSFNNSMLAMFKKQNPYSIPTNYPFLWSNGIYEIPVTEKNIFARFTHNLWARFQYPLSKYVKYRTGWQSYLPYSVSVKDQFLVCLIHSWSLLYRDQHGYEFYRDDKMLEGYRKLIRKLSLDFDIITSHDLLDLIKSGKILPSHIEKISCSNMVG